ncbi:hypothetical protein BO78DRAFT_189029 [Aspergillus sclerotiicarbonarius CBS 121057]|uniref:Uncharacterized protein n=1 Tax=Aspergillus sclerotiicarbonarius (strain CBS 121057 / IBT 28362) TaxID=1448318 RepID=A0A319ESG7_ASPSB|nr:hypothetical protein BO78DRAFT_189029 [Aspergillus sclerotiicarbonarius CBS 121057]
MQRLLNIDCWRAARVFSAVPASSLILWSGVSLPCSCQSHEVSDQMNKVSHTAANKHGNGPTIGRTVRFMSALFLGWDWMQSIRSRTSFYYYYSYAFLYRIQRTE